MASRLNKKQNINFLQKRVCMLLFNIDIETEGAGCRFRLKRRNTLAMVFGSSCLALYAVMAVILIAFYIVL